MLITSCIDQKQGQMSEDSCEWDISQSNNSHQKRRTATPTRSRVEVQPQPASSTAASKSTSIRRMAPRQSAITHLLQLFISFTLLQLLFQPQFQSLLLVEGTTSSSSSSTGSDSSIATTTSNLPLEIVPSYGIAFTFSFLLTSYPFQQLSNATMFQLILLQDLETALDSAASSSLNPLPLFPALSSLSSRMQIISMSSAYFDDTSPKDKVGTGCVARDDTNTTIIASSDSMINTTTATSTTIIPPSPYKGWATVEVLFLPDPAAWVDANTVANITDLLQLQVSFDQLMTFTQDTTPSITISPFCWDYWHNVLLHSLFAILRSRSVPVHYCAQLNGWTQSATCEFSLTYSAPNTVTPPTVVNTTDYSEQWKEILVVAGVFGLILVCAAVITGIYFYDKHEAKKKAKERAARIMTTRKVRALIQETHQAHKGPLDNVDEEDEDEEDSESSGARARRETQPNSSINTPNLSANTNVNTGADQLLSLSKIPPKKRYSVRDHTNSKSKSSTPLGFVPINSPPVSPTKTKNKYSVERCKNEPFDLELSDEEDETTNITSGTPTSPTATVTSTTIATTTISVPSGTQGISAWIPVSQDQPPPPPPPVAIIAPQPVTMNSNVPSYEDLMKLMALAAGGGTSASATDTATSFIDLGMITPTSAVAHSRASSFSGPSSSPSAPRTPSRSPRPGMPSPAPSPPSTVAPVTPTASSTKVPREDQTKVSVTNGKLVKPSTSSSPSSPSSNQIKFIPPPSSGSNSRNQSQAVSTSSSSLTLSQSGAPAPPMPSMPPKPIPTFTHLPTSSPSPSPPRKSPAPRIPTSGLVRQSPTSSLSPGSAASSPTSSTAASSVSASAFPTAAAIALASLKKKRGVSRRLFPSKNMQS